MAKGLAIKPLELGLATKQVKLAAHFMWFTGLQLHFGLVLAAAVCGTQLAS